MLSRDAADTREAADLDVKDAPLLNDRAVDTVAALQLNLVHLVLVDVCPNHLTTHWLNLIKAVGRDVLAGAVPVGLAISPSVTIEPLGPRISFETCTDDSVLAIPARQ